MTPKQRHEHDRFMRALKMWDRPENQLFGTPLDGDADTDAFVDQVFSVPSRGIVVD